MMLRLISDSGSRVKYTRGSWETNRLFHLARKNKKEPATSEQQA